MSKKSLSLEKVWVAICGEESETVSFETTKEGIEALKTLASLVGKSGFYSANIHLYLTDPSFHSGVEEVPFFH